MWKTKSGTRETNKKMFRSIFAILFRFVLILSLVFSSFLALGRIGATPCKDCRDLQGYSCTRLHNLNRPSERDKEGTESSVGRQLAAATCQSCNSLGTAAKCLSSSWSRRGWTCLLQTAAILHCVHWSLLVCCLLPSATCHLPHAALQVHQQQQFINLFTSSRRQLPHNQSIGGAWTAPGMGVAWR